MTDLVPHDVQVQHTDTVGPSYQFYKCLPVYSAAITHPQQVRPEAECSKAMAEFARIEEQLNGVERYAMKYLEEENAEFAAAQLRLAEVCKTDH